MDEKIKLENIDENIKLLSGKLKGFCEDNGKEKDTENCAKIFYQMGKEYEKLSDNCEDKHEQKFSLIRSAVLLNAAIVRNPENVADIKSELLNLCFKSLRLANAQRLESDLPQKSKEVLLKIDCMRNKVMASLKELDMNKAFDQHKRVELVEKIQCDITNEYKSIMSDIMEFCVSIMGNPPCEYSLIGMGSLARNEITPYSDFEHAYILEDNIQTRSDYEDVLDYFRWVSVIFHLIVINLGETIVPNVSVPHINDQVCKENDWFFDENTPRGISFDGMMPHASKFPLGRNKTKSKDWKTELIKPVSGMLKYLESEEAVKNGYRLAEVLVNSCYVSGSFEVYSAYQQGVMECAEKSFDLQKVSSGLDADFKNFNPLTTLPTFHQKQVFNVKRLIYRSTSLFVAALGHIHKISAQSSFAIIRKLHQINVITKPLMESALLALSLACETRLTVYIKRKGQYDLVDVNQGNEDNFKLSLIGMLGENNVVAYFETALQLQSLVQKVCRGDNDDTTYGLDKLNKMTILYWLKKYENAISESQLLLKELPSDDFGRFFCHHTMFYCFVNLKQFEEATKVYGEIQADPNCCINNDVAAMVYHKAAEHGCVDEKKKYLKKEINLRETLLERTKYFSKKHSLLMQLAQCLEDCDDYDKALKYFKQAYSLICEGKIPFQVRELIECQMGKAKCYYNLSDFETAISCYDSALLRLNIVKQRDLTDKSLYDIASCHRGLGMSHLKLEDFTKFLEHLKTAVGLWIELGCTENLNLLCKTLAIFGEDFMKQRDYLHAVTCYEQELEIHILINSKNLCVKSDLYMRLGLCFHELGEKKEALEWLKQAREILSSLHGKKVETRIAWCDAMLGAACLAVGEFEIALNHSRACLKVIPDSQLDYLSLCYFTIGQCLLHFNQPTNALDSFQDSLKLYEKLNHPKAVECRKAIESCQLHAHFQNVA